MLHNFFFKKHLDQVFHRMPCGHFSARKKPPCGHGPTRYFFTIWIQCVSLNVIFLTSSWRRPQLTSLSLPCQAPSLCFWLFCTSCIAGVKKTFCRSWTAWIFQSARTSLCPCFICAFKKKCSLLSDVKKLWKVNKWWHEALRAENTSVEQWGFCNNLKLLNQAYTNDIFPLCHLNFF